MGPSSVFVGILHISSFLNPEVFVSSVRKVVCRWVFFSNIYIQKTYLPLINFFKLYGCLKPVNGLHLRRYNPNVNPTTINSFTTTAYRFGHSQINNEFLVQHGGFAVPIKSMYFRPDLVYNQGT